MSPRAGGGPIVTGRWLLFAGVLAYLVSCIAINRSPLAWFDEVYFVSAARSLAEGGNGAPTLTIGADTNIPYPIIYGPVFFWAEALAVKLFGLSLFAGRIVSLVFALVVVGVASQIVTCLTAVPAWGMATFGLLMLSPEIGSSATNGRMDTLSVAFELAGLLVFLRGAMAPPQRGAWMAGAAAGILWAAALLSTPRTFTFFMAVAVAITGFVALGPRESARRVAVMAAIAAAVIALAVALWARHLGVTPATWAFRTVAASRANSYTVGGNGLPRLWSVGAGWLNVLTTLAAAPVLVALLVGWRKARPQWFPWFTFVLAIAVVNAGITIATTNMTFLRSIQFALLLAGVAIAGASTMSGRMLRIVSAWGVLVAIAFAGIRVVKAVDVVETWTARSADGLEAMVRDHVPPHLVVIGYDEYYFYAVERSGSVFRAALLGGGADASMRSFRDQWRDTYLAVTREDPSPAPSFLIWPDHPRWPMPSYLRCAEPYVVSRYEPPPDRRSVLDRVPFTKTLAVLRTYPPSVLYRLPPGCGRLSGPT